MPKKTQDRPSDKQLPMIDGGKVVQSNCEVLVALEEGLRQGLEDIAEGRTRLARQVFAELREQYGIRG